jgi:hypothetical protein
MQNSGLARDEISAVGVGADGRVWIGSSWGGGLSIYTPAGPPVPIFLADFRAARGPEGVRLSWRLGQERSSLVGLEVERAPAHDGPYERRTIRHLEPAPSMVYTDCEAGPDAEYWYRIVLVGSDGFRSFSSPIGVPSQGSGGETRLFVPVQVAPDFVQLRYSIGGARVPVRIQIYDIAGRCVATFDPGLLDDGNYLQSWRRVDGSGRSVARGVYLVRLTAGGRAAAQKIVLAR